MITVMGATGNVGGGVVRRLAAAGEPVRALGRRPGSLAALAELGVETMTVDAADASALAPAFAGSTAVHVMLPFDPVEPDFRAHQNLLGSAIVTAVRESGVRRVVAQSSLGADLSGGTGFISSLYEQEQRLRDLTEVHVLYLRPGLFQETIVTAAPMVSDLGFFADVVAPDVPVPMVATRDIAAVAAAALRRRDWTGHRVHELLGPHDLTYRDATLILGAALGRPELDYVQLPDREMSAALQQAGFSADAAELQVAMGRALSDGTITSREGRTAETSTPTAFDDVVGDLLSAAGLAR